MGILIVGIGGAIGATLRYLIGLMVTGLIGRTEVLTGTVISNLTGCFLAGLTLATIQTYTALSDELILFLTVGILGSLTTFSTFALELLQLIKKKKISDLLFYLLLQIVIAFLMVISGYELATWLLISGGS